MTDATPGTPQAAETTPPAVPLRVRLRRRAWWALPASAVLVLLLAEISAPPHAAFAELDFLLFHVAYGVLAAAVALGIARAVERVLVRPGIYGDD